MAGLVTWLDANGADLISAKTMLTLLAGTTGVALKFGVRNVGDRALGLAEALPAVQVRILALGVNDGSGRLRLKKDVDTLSRPWGLAAVVSAPGAGGVFVTVGTKGYVVVAKKGTGRTVASAQLAVPVAAVTQTVALTWVNVTGNTGYEIHFTDTPGDYSAATLIGETAADVATFNHTGAAGGAGTPALVNTTGGVGPAYGTPPAGLDVAVAPFLIGQAEGTLAIGEEAFVWVNRVVPSNSTPAGNRRVGLLRVSEGTV